MRPEEVHFLLILCIRKSIISPPSSVCDPKYSGLELEIWENGKEAAGSQREEGRGCAGQMGVFLTAERVGIFLQE